MQQTLPTYQGQVKSHNRFLSCQNCNRCKTRTKACLWRGRIPADILFVGQEPTIIEDQVGYPLLGIEGEILESIIKAAIDFRRKEVIQNYGQTDDETPQITYCITTQLSCYSDSERFMEDEFESCLPRLLDLIKTVNPQLIVLVGIDLLIPINVQVDTPLDIKFLSSIPMVKIVDLASLSQKTEQIGKEQVVPLFRQQVSIIINALRRI